MTSSNSQPDTTKPRSVLLFNLVSHLFCIDLSLVNKVIYFTKTQFVPGMPAYLIGLLNLHGTNIPVIDLAMRFEIERTTAFTVNTPVILCDNKTSQVGLVVDEILDVESSNTSELQMQGLFKGEIAVHMQGTIHTLKGDALLLNLQKIFEEHLVKE